MLRFSDKQEAEKYILSIPKFAAKTGPDNLKKLLEKLGRPDRSFRVIHIAGTNGKGSVARLISESLINAGHITGLFTSPHMLRINERISVDRTDISDGYFCRLSNELMERIEEFVEEGNVHPSFFEFVFLMSVMYFAEQKVEYAVMETGLGGRLDATNILESDISVITSIGMDHMQYLGNTIEEIAYEKAGIIKDRKPVVYNIPNPAAREVIENRAGELGSPMYNAGNVTVTLKNLKADSGKIDFSLDCGYYSVDNLELRSLAMYEVENAVTALTALYALSNCDQESGSFIDSEQDQTIKKNRFDRLKASFKKAASDFEWTGRMEFVRPNVLLDGAHNVPAVERLLDSLDKLLPLIDPTKVKLLFAVAKDKDYDSIIRLMMKRLNIDTIYVTGIEGDRKTELSTVEDIFRKYLNDADNEHDAGDEQYIKKTDEVTINKIPSIETAYHTAKAELDKDELLICMGSLYLIADILEVEKNDQF